RSLFGGQRFQIDCFEPTFALPLAPATLGTRLAYGIPFGSSRTSRVCVRAFLVEDGERRKGEMPDLRRATPFCPVLQSPLSPGLVHASRWLPTVWLSLRARTRILPPLDFRHQLRRRRASWTSHLSRTRFLAEASNLVGSNTDHHSHADIQSFLRPAFESILPRIRPLLRSSPRRR